MFYYLPKLDCNNSDRIMMTFVKDSGLENKHISAIIKWCHFVFDYNLINDPVPGFILIFDLKNLTLPNLPAVTKAGQKNCAVSIYNL